MKNYPFYPSRQTKSLDGSWQFKWLGDVDIDNIEPLSLKYDTMMAVPGVFDTCPDYFGKRGVGVYRRKFDFNSERGDTLRLTLEGLGLYGRIWLDGEEADCYNLPYSEVSYDFNVAGARVHEVIIAVDNRFNFEQSPLFSPNFDFYAFGGIYRSVYLQKLPEMRLEKVQVKTLELSSGKVMLNIFVNDLSNDKISFSVCFDNGEVKNYTQVPVNGKIALELNVPNFKVWSPESPSLHTVEVSIEGDSVVERFGIRTVTAEKQQILLNGSPVFLKGVNRHESHPEFGPVQNTHLMLEDLLIMKDLGCNFVRCVHYPQNQEFLELCDELGFLVWHESMGWNNTPEDVENEHFFELQVRQTELMAANSINHPSIILWGFMNECCSHSEPGRKLYKKLVGAIKAQDSELLVTYASNRHEADICFDLVDVIAMTMYPGWIDEIDDHVTPPVKRIKGYVDKQADCVSCDKLKDKPFIVAEIGVCGIYGCHDRGYAQWSEEAQAEYMSEAYRCVMENSRYNGIALWQLFDTRSYVNAGQVRSKPRGFNCAGLLDEYRRPKMVYDKIKDIYTA